MDNENEYFTENFEKKIQIYKLRNRHLNLINQLKDGGIMPEDISRYEKYIKSAYLFKLRIDGITIDLITMLLDLLETNPELFDIEFIQTINEDAIFSGTPDFTSDEFIHGDKTLRYKEEFHRSIHYSRFLISKLSDVISSFLDGRKMNQNMNLHLREDQWVEVLNFMKSKDFIFDLNPEIQVEMAEEFIVFMNNLGIFDKETLIYVILAFVNYFTEMMRFTSEINNYFIRDSLLNIFNRFSYFFILLHTFISEDEA